MDINFDFTHPDDVIRLTNRFALYDEQKFFQLSFADETKIKELQKDLEDLENEITKYFNLFERKMIDRIGLREIEEKLIPRRDIARHKLNTILIENSLYAQENKTAIGLKEKFSSEVLMFSIANVDLDGCISSLMVVPDIFRRNTKMWFEEFTFWSAEAPLGRALLRKQIGTTSFAELPSGTTQKLPILSTQLAPLEILRALSNSYSIDLDVERVNKGNPSVLPPGNGGERRKQQLRPH